MTVFGAWQMSGDKGISAFPDGDNLFRWIGTITGPSGTVCIAYVLHLLILQSTVFVLFERAMPVCASVVCICLIVTGCKCGCNNNNNNNTRSSIARLTNMSRHALEKALGKKLG